MTAQIPSQKLFIINKTPPAEALCAIAQRDAACIFQAVGRKNRIVVPALRRTYKILSTGQLLWQNVGKCPSLWRLSESPELICNGISIDMAIYGRNLLVYHF